MPVPRPRRPGGRGRGRSRRRAGRWRWAGVGSWRIRWGWGSWRSRDERLAGADVGDVRCLHFQHRGSDTGLADARQRRGDPPSDPGLAAVEELESLARALDRERAAEEVAGLGALPVAEVTQELDQLAAVVAFVALDPGQDIARFGLERHLVEESGQHLRAGAFGLEQRVEERRQLVRRKAVASCSANGFGDLARLLELGDASQAGGG